MAQSHCRVRSSSYFQWWVRQNSHKLNTDYKQPFRNLFIVKQFFPFSTRRNVGRIASMPAISLVRSLILPDKRTPLEGEVGGEGVNAGSGIFLNISWIEPRGRTVWWIASLLYSVLRALSHPSSPTRDDALRMFAWEATIWRNCMPIFGLKVF